MAGTFECSLGHEHPACVGADVVAQVTQIVLLRGLDAFAVAAVEDGKAVVHELAAAGTLLSEARPMTWAA